jgi:DNA-binding transcriptional LysR family regulator
MPVDLGNTVIGPLLPDFLRQYPSISMDIDLSSRHVDLMVDKIDVAIRLGQVRDGKLIAKTLGRIEMGLFASPVYLEMRGQPERPDDLHSHECVMMLTDATHAIWQFEAAKARPGAACKVPVSGKFKLKNQSLMRLLAERGMGITPLAFPLAADAVAQGRLVRVLPEWRMPALPIQALTTSRLQSAKSRAFVDFLAARLSL